MTEGDEKNKKKMEPSYRREEQMQKERGLYNQIK